MYLQIIFFSIQYYLGLTKFINIDKKTIKQEVIKKLFLKFYVLLFNPFKNCSDTPHPVQQANYDVEAMVMLHDDFKSYAS